MMAREKTHDRAFAVPRVRLCYKVWKICIVMLFHQHYLATLFVRNATMLPTQHVIICQVLVENYV